MGRKATKQTNKICICLSGMLPISLCSLAIAVWCSSYTLVQFSQVIQAFIVQPFFLLAYVFNALDSNVGFCNSIIL
jgi:hypothetical protein